MRSAEQLHEGPYHSAGRVIENIIIIRPDASQYGASGLFFLKFQILTYEVSYGILNITNAVAEVIYTYV